MANFIYLEDLLVKECGMEPFYSFPILPVGGRVVIGAESKSYKSFLALNMACDLAEGKPIFGTWQVVRPLKVLYLEKEIGEFRLQERMRLIQEGRGNPPRERSLSFVSKDATVKLDTIVGQQIIENLVELVKPDVVFIDPLRKFHEKEENSSTDMAIIFGALQAIQERQKFSMVMVHHTSKPVTNVLGTKKTKSPNDLRGSGEIFGDADSVIMLDRPKPDVDKRLLHLNFTLRSAEDPKPLALRLTDACTFELA